MSESMTFGARAMTTELKLVRVQEKGQLTLPAETRRRIGLEEGDLVAIVETPEGVLITPQKVVATWALDRIGEVLREQGLTLEELIASGRDQRDDLLREHYGIDPS